MAASELISLPASGLADDILARFVAGAQMEADQEIEKKVLIQGERLLHLVTFRLGGEEYGVDIQSVQEIIRAVDITPVPGSPGHVRGVINLRGRIIPVVDLRLRFGLDQAESSDALRIIVVEIGEKRLGMLVDSVSQVTKFSSAVVEEMPEEATGVDSSYIRGVAKLDSRLIIMIDLNNSLLVRQ